MLLLMSFFRGGKSPISFAACSPADWIILTFFIALMAIIVVISVKMVASEQALKEKYGRVNLSESDLIFKGSVLR